MAEETQKPAAPEVVVSNVFPAKDATVAETEGGAPPESAPVLEPQLEQKEKSAPPPPAGEEPAPKISLSDSFKEESNIVSELPEPQRKALEELKKLILEALNKHEFTSPPSPPPPTTAEEEEKKPKEASAEPVAEEKPAVGEKAAAESTLPPPPASEEPAKKEETPAEKTEEKPVVEKTEQPAPPAKEKEKAVAEAESVAVSQVVEKVTTTVGDDGAKTVETVKESVVSVSATPAPTEMKAETKAKEEVETKGSADAPPHPPPEEVFLWGIPLLGDERCDVILLKFLRARDFKVKETLAMIKRCVRWRKEFGVDSLLDEDLGNEYEKVVFTHGCDKQGRPVVYNVFGEFNDKDLYQLAFSDAEKQKKFLKWLVQFVERTVRKFDFTPSGINSFLIVNDLQNSPGYGKRELYKIFGKYMMLLQDVYPEFVCKQVCINVSFWYLAYSWVCVNIFTPRSKSKFVFSSSSKTPETLFRYIAPEQVPVEYGGHSRAGELEFTAEDAVAEVTIKPSSSHPLEFLFNEPCTFVWELRVVGWDVNYDAQFVPTEGYTVLVSKPKKMTPSDDPIVCDSFKVNQPGKLIISIDNHSSKKKKLLYRSKNKTSE